MMLWEKSRSIVTLVSIPGSYLLIYFHDGIQTERQYKRGVYNLPTSLGVGTDLFRSRV